jgi:hypothetical protein
MKTINITLYKFEELSKEAQQKAIEDNYNINTGFEWYDFILEDITENENIFENIKIYFSGFYSQGDGSMFEYNGINAETFKTFLNEEYKHLTEKRRMLIFDNINITAKGKQKGHYYHENSCSHYIDIELNQGYIFSKHSNIYNLIVEINQNFESYLIDLYKTKCIEIYKNLNDSYDYLQSDEVIKETLISNDYDFTEEGEIY